MSAGLLAEGQARVAQTLQKGYAPTHFSHNLELIFVEDTRSASTASMTAKIASTRERSACLQTLDSTALIWWATAFPMRQWSGGRKMSSSVFDALVRQAPEYASHGQALLAAVSDDLARLREKYARCSMLQSFLEDLSNEPQSLWEPFSAEVQALSEERRYINLSGARYDSLPRLADLLAYGLEGSRKYKEERNKTALISTALKFFVPTNPTKDDAYLLFPIGAGEIWCILHELGIETPSDIPLFCKAPIIEYISHRDINHI